MKLSFVAGMSKSRAISYLMSKGVYIFYCNFRRRDNSGYLVVS
jgi:hypothetical protein